MEKIRIGVLAENHFPRIGGMEIYYHMLACAAQRHPHLDLAVACSAMPDIPRRFAYPYPVYRARSLSVLTRYLYRRNVARMVRRERIDVLLGPMLHGGGYLAVNLKKKLGLPAIVQSHGADVQRVEGIGYGAMLNPAHAARVRYTIEHADLILAQSELNRDMILKLGAPAERVRILPPGVDNEKMRQIPFEDLRMRYGIAPGTFVIVTVGRNRPIKRLDLLLDALALLRRRGVDFKYLCVGPAQDVRGPIAQRGLEADTIFAGPIGAADRADRQDDPPFPEMVNHYRAADLFVSVSYVEALNLAALDAMAAGVPVLVTAAQGVIDHIDDGRTGFLLRDESPSALADLVFEIARDRDVLRTRRDEIRDSVAGLTWDRSVRALHSLAAPLLARRSAVVEGGAVRSRR